MTNVLAINLTNAIADYENDVRVEMTIATNEAYQAIEHSEKAQAAYYRMYLNCAQLQAMKVHRRYNMTWDEYFCYLTGYGSSTRFYQLKRVIEHAIVIYENLGIVPSEYELREFPVKDVPANEPAKVLEVYRIGKLSAQVRDGTNALKAIDFEEAQNVIGDIQSTLITKIDDDNHEVNLDEIISNMLANRHDERESRRNQHIIENLKWELVKRENVIGVGLRKQSRIRIRARMRVPVRNVGKIQLYVKKRKE